MKEIKNDSTEAVNRFGRDKRTRTVRTEHVEPRPFRNRENGRQNDGDETQGEQPRRRSFNPNFSADNRPVRDFARRPAYNSRDGFNNGNNTYERQRDNFGRDERRNNDGEGDRFARPRNNGGSRFSDRPTRYNGDRRPRFDDNRNRYDENRNRFDDNRNRYDENRNRFDDNRNRYDDNRNRFDRNRSEEWQPETQEDFFGPRAGHREDSHSRFDNRGDNRRRPYGQKAAQGAHGGKKPYRSKPAGDGFGKFEGKPAGAGRKGFAKHPKADEKPKTYPKYKPEVTEGEIRLNRFIAQSGMCSRREADTYITAGVVTVNGNVVTELGTKILPTDEVRFNDRVIRGEQNVYLVLNKPKGYVTTLDDPHASKIVTDLVKNACKERIYPVGRLDKNSLGLLLFTNDGELTKQLTHPSYNKKKTYQVTLDKPLTHADMEKIAAGITLEDGDIFADEISYIKENKKEIGIEIHSGRNRIVRRIFEHLGYTVQKLDRVYYAGLTKKNLKRGAWRFLTKEEVRNLKAGLYE